MVEERQDLSTVQFPDARLATNEASEQAQFLFVAVQRASRELTRLAQVLQVAVDEVV